MGAFIARLLADVLGMPVAITVLGGRWVDEAITLRILTGGTLIVAGMLLAELGHLLRLRRKG
jgi:drug/metabolite transporter (DMT)-like permease